MRSAARFILTLAVYLAAIAFIASLSMDGAAFSDARELRQTVIPLP